LTGERLFITLEFTVLVILREAFAMHLIRWFGSDSFWVTGKQKEILSLLADASFHTAAGTISSALMGQAGYQEIEKVFAGTGVMGKIIVPGDEPGTFKVTIPFPA
jgi:hypothetical protein